jgi:hypothetical protein
MSNLNTFSSAHCQKEKYSNETKLFSNIKFNVLGSWADNKINNDILAMLIHFKLSSDSTKIKIKNSHFRYSTVDFRYTTSIASCSQPRTITSGLRIRFSTSGSLYPISNYEITSGFQHPPHNIRFPTTDLLPVSNYGITSGVQPRTNFRFSKYEL